MRPLQEIARGDRIGETKKALLEHEDRLIVETWRGCRRHFGRELQDQAARRLQHAIIAQQGQGFKMFVEALDLEGNRARIKGIEHDHVAHGVESHAHEITRAVGDLQVDKIEQDVEIVGRRVAAREMAGKAAGIDAPLDPPASVEDAPAGAANHVFLGKTRDRRDCPQSGVGTLESLGLGEWPMHFDGEVAIEIADQPPRVRGQPFANERGGALRVAHER